MLISFPSALSPLLVRPLKSVMHGTYGYLPSHGASPPIGSYQQGCEQLAQSRYSAVPGLGVEPAAAQPLDCKYRPNPLHHCAVPAGIKIIMLHDRGVYCPDLVFVECVCCHHSHLPTCGTFVKNTSRCLPSQTCLKPSVL